MNNKTECRFSPEKRTKDFHKVFFSKSKKQYQVFCNAMQLQQKINLRIAAQFMLAVKAVQLSVAFVVVNYEQCNARPYFGDKLKSKVSFTIV